jgi:hypothetical protein
MLRNGSFGAVADTGCNGEGKPAISDAPSRPSHGSVSVSLHLFAHAQNEGETPAPRGVVGLPTPCSMRPVADGLF